MYRKLGSRRLALICYTCAVICVTVVLVRLHRGVRKQPQQFHPVFDLLMDPRAVLSGGLSQQQQHQFHQSRQPKDTNFIAVEDWTVRYYQPSVKRQLLWFMARGTVYPHPLPSPRAPAKLWPEENPTSDRILEQLMYTLDEFYEGASVTAIAPTYSNNILSTSKPAEQVKIKTILIYDGLSLAWGVQNGAGREIFVQQKCPVNACQVTDKRPTLPTSDVVVFKDFFSSPQAHRPTNQLWVMYMLESPLNSQNFREKDLFNLTATYRLDSDIVTPYEKWVYYDENVRSLPQIVNFAEGKTKKVAWFVSNCAAKNSRLEFAHELGKYIQTDIYGACGSHACSRANAKHCFDILSQHYKFYLAFENSNCRDYITEKFFVNGLGSNLLPIVMGAHPADYKRVAPEKSYIHVDDFASPKELAQYLLTLDTSDELYNEYFEWKGTGEFVNTHFFCRLCAMAHYADRAVKKTRSYEDMNKWWRGPNVCTEGSWQNYKDIL